MTKLPEYRKRAVEILLKLADKDIPMLIDYQLDTALRSLLSIPEAPINSTPYKGWMIGESNASNSTMKTSQAGINLIKRWEGKRNKAYVCPGGVWTIGYGHTKGAYQGLTIPDSQAEYLLKEDLKVYEDAVTRLVKVSLTQNQFDALVSFTFNVGINAFKNSTLLRLLNQGKYSDAANQFKRWVKAGRKTLPGLVKRREAEKELFVKS